MVDAMTETALFTGPQPERQHETDAGYDLAAVGFANIPPGEFVALPTGLRVAIPAGHAGLILPRSGLALKRGVTVLNAPGLIDSGFRGEIMVVLINHGKEPFGVMPGDRIAQLVFAPVTHPHWKPMVALPPADRGDAGFGSTGVG